MQLRLLKLLWTTLTQFFHRKPIPVPSPVAIQPPVPVPSPVVIQPTICKPRPTSPGFVVGKKGFGTFLKSTETLNTLLSLDVYWNYGWNLDRYIPQPLIPMYIPMVWGKPRSNVSDFEQALFNYPNLKSYIDNGTIKYLMGFNEPDLPTQSNMNVTDAIKYWPVLEKLNIPLISPSCAKPIGEWMTEFMKIANEKCYRIDYIGIHWYGEPNPSGFITNMNRYYNMYQIPLVISEFGIGDFSATNVSGNRYTETQVLNFMKVVLPWLENTTWIAGYSWFYWFITSPTGTTSALFDTNGNLTKLGRYYKSVRTNNIMGNQSIV